MSFVQCLLLFRIVFFKFLFFLKSKRQQEELERRAADIERREAELRRTNTNGIRRNNWPPLPEKCCFQPCFYQDIAVEIPIEFQKIVRQLYYLWMCKFFSSSFFPICAFGQ